MHRRTLLVAVAGGLAGTGGCAELARPDGTDTAEESRAGTTTTLPPPDGPRGELERAVHGLVTDERTSRGLDRLSFDTDLREIARYHSRDMAEEGYFAHASPDGEVVTDRYERFDYECEAPTEEGYLTGGENIYMERRPSGDWDPAALAERTVEGWMDSPGHRENLLRDAWRREGIGVAVAEGDSTRIYVTQNFC